MALGFRVQGVLGSFTGSFRVLLGFTLRAPLRVP